MRQIDHNLIAALNNIRRGSTVNCHGNTVVQTCDQGVTTVRLHGNLICTIDEGRIYIGHCGYITATTAAHLHTIARTLTGGSVYRSQGSMYYRNAAETLTKTVERANTTT